MHFYEYHKMEHRKHHGYQVHIYSPAHTFLLWILEGWKDSDKRLLLLLLQETAASNKRLMS